MSLPNYITFIRIFISPIFLFLYIEYEAFGISLKVLPYVLIFLLAISELSDAFDGYIARRTNQVSDLGKILDPMADSIYRISVFLTFTQGIIQLPLLLVFVFIYRDAVISTLRTICALRGFALAARMSGKLKAVLQAIAAFFILIMFALYTGEEISLTMLRTMSFWSVAFVCIYTLFSGVDYIYANREYVKKILTSST
ncbi:MAG: CDP-diacylglycerol--glycerol-3-phosphate 3-phosphatidyltransferase [Chlamydiales bacterium]|nr:CDP-diacylglycerol--glycerol-3-phosphate 3-phosphatidyltransferase [Chlamydiales bacterium]